MTVVSKEVLRAAKGLIQRHGHAKGDEEAFHPERAHGYCVATACVAACSIREQEAGHPATIVHFFKSVNGLDMTRSLGDWNDAPERTKAEVLAAFDVAILEGAAQVPGALKGPKPPKPPAIEKRQLKPRLEDPKP